jgi:hypothetical protein
MDTTLPYQHFRSSRKNPDLSEGIETIRHQYITFRPGNKCLFPGFLAYFSQNPAKEKIFYPDL